MDFGLREKKAVVCAASRGLGLATAKALAKEGCQLHLLARSADLLEDACSTLKKEYGVATSFTACDLAKPAHIPDVVHDIRSKMGNPDVLINNIGGPKPSPAFGTPAEAWQSGFEQLFLSSTLLTQQLLPTMRQALWGRVITITSISVVEPIDHLAVSTAMRAAVTGFHKTLAREVAADGVTVNLSLIHI